MARIQIPVVLLEFDEDGNTLWVHSPIGATVLRIKSMKGFVVDRACENSVAHADIIIEGPLDICVPPDMDDVRVEAARRGPLPPNFFGALGDVPTEDDD